MLLTPSHSQCHSFLLSLNPHLLPLHSLIPTTQTKVSCNCSVYGRCSSVAVIGCDVSKPAHRHIASDIAAVDHTCLCSFSISSCKSHHYPYMYISDSAPLSLLSHLCQVPRSIVEDFPAVTKVSQDNRQIDGNGHLTACCSATV